MGRYRKIEVRIWSDEKFRRLSPIPPCGQGLFVFLLSGPHTGPIPGLFRAGRAAMAEELGWSLEAFRKGFAEALDQGMVKADFDARLVWLPNAIKHNKPESSNVIKSWRGEFDLLPECPLKQEAIEGMRQYLQGAGDGYLQAFNELFRSSGQVIKPSGKPLPKPSRKPSRKPSGKACPNQEQEQEQEQDCKSAHNFFEKFWEIYPPRNGKKLNKAGTLAVFNKLCQEDQAACVLAARHYRQSDLVSRGLGIKDPKRFLCDGKNNEPWRDWIEPEIKISTNGSTPTSTICTRRVMVDGKSKPCTQAATVFVGRFGMCESCHASYQEERAAREGVSHAG